MKRIYTMTNPGETSTFVEQKDNATTPMADGAQPALPAQHENSLRAVTQKIFSFPVLMGTLLVATVVLCSRLNLPDPDTWWHLAMGKQILATRTLPRSDSYSFTAPGAPWIAYEWLGEVAMAMAAKLGALRGIAFFVVACAAAFTALLFAYATLVSRNSKAALIACTLFVPITPRFFTARPQLIGYAFLILTLILLERFRQGKQRSLWVLPPLFLVWVNTHGSFALGLVVFGVYWACGLTEFEAGGIIARRWTDWQRRHMEIIFLLCVLALTVSPYGTRQAAYPMQMAFFQPLNVSHVAEWQSLTFGSWEAKLLLALVLVFWLANIPLKSSFRLENVVLLLFATYACFVHLRFVPFLVLTFAPLLAELIARWIPRYEPSKDRHPLNAVLMALVAAGLVMAFPSRRTLENVISQHYPVKAVEYLSHHPYPGRMLNEYNWGGYLIWSGRSHHRVFIDGRADFYEYAGVFSDYLHIFELKPNATTLMRRYDIRLCLISRKEPLRTLLASSPDWREVYSDKLAVIFVRRPSQSRISVPE